MLQKFLNDFLSEVPQKLPELLDTNTMDPILEYEDNILLTFPLSKPYDIEEIMDFMEDEMELVILYYHMPSSLTSFKHSCCAYANPAYGQLYKLNATTDADGAVNEITATIYDSLENLCSALCLDLDLHSHSGHFQYQRKKQDILLDFI